MKKSLLTIVGLTIMALSLYAQQTYSYSGQMSFTTSIMGVGGNEKYTYIFDENGRQKLHGTYSFSGSNYLEDNTNKLDAKYSIVLNCKNGALDGVVNIKGDYKSESYSWAKGWQQGSITTRLSGIFKEGKPNGLFSISFSGDQEGSASCTLKDGKYIGTYSYDGYVIYPCSPFDCTYWYIMKGQLTNDGKLTGKWIYDTQKERYNLEFINDVLISRSNNKSATSPKAQEIAKKYARNEITKEQVLEQGFFIEEGSLPLDYVIDQYILHEEFNLGKGPKYSYDLSEYTKKTYSEIIEINMLRKEGFEILKKSISQLGNDKYRSGGYYAVNKYGADTRLCNFAINYNEKYNLPFLRCEEEFTEKYGTKFTGHWENDQKIHLTPAQEAEWTNLLIEYALRNKVDFIEFFNEREHPYYESYDNYLSIAYSKHKENKLEEWLYEAANNYVLNSLKEKLDQLILEFDSKKICDYGFKFIEDHKYIIPIKGNKSYELAYINDIETMKLIKIQVDKFVKLKEDYEKRDEYICKRLKEIGGSYEWYIERVHRNSKFQKRVERQEIVYGIVNSIDTINKYKPIISDYLVSYPKIKSSYNKHLVRANISEYDTESWEKIQNKYNALNNCVNHIFTTYRYLTLRDSLANINAKITSQLPAEALKLYSQIYKESENIQYYADKAYESKFAELFDAQNGYLKWSELYSQAIDKDNSIKEQIITYKDLSKTLSALYIINNKPIISNKQDAEKVCNQLDSLIDIQEKCIIFIAERKKIDVNTNRIIDKCANYKDILKAYQSYLKTLNLTWTTDASIQTLLDVQQVQKNFIQAMNSDNVTEINTQIKKNKDKSIEAVIRILEN